MTPPMDLLDHATELFPEPPGALERLHARHARRRRNRRLAAIGTVAAIWIVLALIATGAFDARQEPTPTDDPVETPVDTPVQRTGTLPSGFPDFPLPMWARPVASRSSQVGQETVMQVWFRTGMNADLTRRWYEDAFPSGSSGWVSEGPGAMLGGIWDLHVDDGVRSAIVLGKTDPGTGRLLHGSDAFPGRWDLYVWIATLPKTQIPDDAVVHGWPGTRANPAGLYSWDAQGSSWMHNPRDGRPGVEMTFSVGSTAPSGSSRVVVDGYDATYESIGVDANGVSRGQWAIDVEGTTVYIVAEIPPGTSEAQLAEAHAIVESIRVEPQEDDPGFRLVFTLPDGWDSG